MSSIPLLLQNDHVLYGALAQLGALSGQAFPSKKTAVLANRIGRGCFDTGLGTFMPTENLAESARWSLYGFQQAALFTLP